MNRLTKEEFDQLDALLGKHGFGGYYDLVECLKIVAGKIGKEKLKPEWEEEINDLPSIVNLLLVIR